LTSWARGKWQTSYKKEGASKHEGNCPLESQGKRENPLKKKRRGTKEEELRRNFFEGRKKNPKEKKERVFPTRREKSVRIKFSARKNSEKRKMN